MTLSAETFVIVNVHLSVASPFPYTGIHEIEV